MGTGPVPRKSLDEMLDGVPEDISQYPLKMWDTGVFNNDLVKENLAPNPNVTADSDTRHTDPSTSGAQIPGNITKGTYDGSQLAILEIFQRIESSYATWFAANGVETDIPTRLTLEDKKKMYQFQPHEGIGSDEYPPHLSQIPWKDKTSLLQIFNFLGIAEAGLLLPKIIPDSFINKASANIQSKILDLIEGTPQEGKTMEAVFQNNKLYRHSGTDIMRGKNIGDYEDWYSDARFAQQYFTGANPTTITKAPDSLFDEFVAEAKKQNLRGVEEQLASADRTSLYVADCSWFRKALGFVPDWDLINKDQLGNKHACAPVTLFELHDDGRLHPLAIVIDYKGSMDKSVVIFNQRITPSDSHSTEALDWPWRYAKTAAQVGDWILHELLVHLGRTHLIEEATIVATHRTIPESNIIYQLLSPHWLKTLSLNAAARQTLVPKIITDLIGFEGTSPYDFIRYDYHNFEWTKRYVPNDLDDRGFPHEQINDKKYRNYGYGQDMLPMWNAIHNFVASMISLSYTTDAAVKGDSYIQAWSQEIQSDTGAQIKTFPTISTVAELVDAVTMCIHIASPQHTAINYLQNFYQAFVVNKPAALFEPLPTSLDQLKAYKEKDLVLALPINKQRQWLLSSTIPWLLSFRPSQDANLINYAASLFNLFKSKPDAPNTGKIQQYAKTLYCDLRVLIETVKENSDNMTPGNIPYTVLDPNNTAVAIII